MILHSKRAMVWLAASWFCRLIPVAIWAAPYPVRRRCCSHELVSGMGFERRYYSASCTASQYVKEFSQDIADEEEAGEHGPSPAALACARESVLEIGRLLLKKAPDGLLKYPQTQSHGDFDSYLTGVRFEDTNLSALSIKALHTVLGYERMTSVQEATLSRILQGKDVLVKSRTGSGKTIAFLLPAIEAVLEACTDSQEMSGVCSVIICPSRELAVQIFGRARSLLHFHTDIRVQVLTGGFRISKERKTVQTSSCQIIVTTPGRLLDHIEKTEGFRHRLEKLKLLVIDEADHVLDMGFQKNIEAIIQHIPAFRQTLLFSATMPKELHEITKLALREDYAFIDADVICRLDSNVKVKQKYMVVPIRKHLAVLYTVLQEHMKQERNYKVLVFCVTSRITAFMFQLYRGLGFNCSEMHSKKSQTYRIHTYNEFRKSEGSTILFTSDVSARGVDYPDVTFVIQIGVPDHGGKYIHRLGRTGRCGKSGEALLILAPWEEFFWEKIQNQPVKRFSLPEFDSSVEAKITACLSNVDSVVRMQAYRTWLGYYKSLKVFGLNDKSLVSCANEFSSSIGFDIPPALPKSVIKKMALQGVPGLTKR